jgi:hypothetical protein
LPTSTNWPHRQDSKSLVTNPSKNPATAEQSL